MNDLVSIITPCFRAQGQIAAAVHSVLQQDHPNWELLIVSDDGENYERELRRQGITDPRIRFFNTRSPQSGPNTARNLALRQSKGQWIAPLDADDVYYPQHLSKLLSAASKTGLALDYFYLRHEHNNTLDKVLEPELPKITGTHFGLDDFFSSHAPLLFLFNRELITEGWDEDLKRSGDTVFNLRALERAGWAELVKTPLHEYRIHNQSLCHLKGAELIFTQAYQQIVKRLSDDGLGFKTQEYREKLGSYFNNKARINKRFIQAKANGFLGNFQEFIALETEL